MRRYLNGRCLKQRHHSGRESYCPPYLGSICQIFWSLLIYERPWRKPREWLDKPEMRQEAWPREVWWTQRIRDIGEWKWGRSCTCFFHPDQRYYGMRQITNYKLKLTCLLYGHKSSKRTCFPQGKGGSHDKGVNLENSRCDLAVTLVWRWRNLSLSANSLHHNPHRQVEEWFFSQNYKLISHSKFSIFILRTRIKGTYT